MTATVEAATSTRATATRRERRKARLSAVTAAVATALAVWVAAEVAFGVDVQAPSYDGSGRSLDIGPGQVVLSAALASLAGWGLLAFLEWRTPRARAIWPVIAAVALLMSLSGPLSGSGVTSTNRTVLVAMHLAVGAVLIPLLARTSPSGQHAGSRRAAVMEQQWP